MHLQIAFMLTESQVPEEYKEFYNSPGQKELDDAPVLYTSHLPILDSFLKPDPRSLVAAKRA